MRNTFKYQVASIVGAVVLLAPSMPAYALSVQPAVQNIVVDPGKGDTRFLRVTNDEDSTQTYFVTIQKFIPKGDNGQQEFLPTTDTSGLPEWMYVDKPELTLKPGESSNLQVSLRVPPGAAAGGYYAALFLSKRQGPDEPLAMLPRLGVLFFVRLNGQVQERLVVSKFSVDADSYDFLPVGFQTTVANEGMVHGQPEGTVTIRNVFGATVAKFAANPDGNRVLPASSRVMSSAWTKGASHEPTSFVDGLRQELLRFAIGPYVATVTFNGPGFAGDEVRDVRFSVWPWRTMSVFVAMLVLMIAGFLLLKKLIIKRATSEPLR